MNFPKRTTETLFFLLLFGYVLVLLPRIPDGRAGYFPRIILPLLIVLITIQLASQSRYIKTRLPEVRLPSIVNYFQEMPEGYDTVLSGNVEDNDLILMLGWTLAAAAIIYLLGTIVGAAIFIATYLYKYGEFRPRKCVFTASLIVIFIYAVAGVFRIPLWGGMLLQLS
jgi:hypothetical protein